jgi:hypothetical protein
MADDKISTGTNMHHDLECADESSSLPLFPSLFVFRDRAQLHEHILEKFTKDRVIYYPKLLSGFITLILPIFNIFTIYRNMIYQRQNPSNGYNVFHLIIFYGEFVEVHTLMLGALFLFILRVRKHYWPSWPGSGRWIHFLDIEFTLMTFDMFKLIPLISVNGFKFILTQIYVTVPTFRKHSLSSQILAFTVLVIAVCLQFVFLLALLLIIVLVKVYQLSFVGEVKDPLQWTINQWLLFTGFSANIINLGDIPTISQLSYMWAIISHTWSPDSNMWLSDEYAATRQIYLAAQICRRLGTVKGFLWLRAMSADDLHSLIRLPPSAEESHASV